MNILVLYFTAFIFTVVTCTKIDIPNMSFTPPTASTHDFNTTIYYTCDMGYNHTYGDLVRTCNELGQWSGLLPNCTRKYTYRTYKHEYSKSLYCDHIIIMTTLL